MDPPPFSGGPITAASPSTTVNYPDSADSSPASRHTDTWDEPPPPHSSTTTAAVTGGKLRLMCSYGGHIFPRPHDKTLCYVGGDTRIFVADRNIPLSDLSARLSKTFLGGREFCLKYQLQNEDLDSLISVTSDEDLENMIDEYDRMSMSNSKYSRLRLFLFPNSNIDYWNPTHSLMKSEDWFVSVLNGIGGGNSGSAPSTKVFSESSSVNCLLGLDDDVVNTDIKEVDVKADVQSVPEVPPEVLDSPMVVETTSSFGSGSSMPALVNLPRIKVHVEEESRKGGGIEEQFSQLNVGIKQKNEASLVVPEPATVVVSGTPVVEHTQQQQQTHQQLQQQLQQQQQPQLLQPKPVIPSDLASPDSVSSEGSGRQRHYFYQEPGVHFQSGSGRISGNSVDLSMSDSIGRVQVKQQVQDGGGGYVLPVQYDQHPQMLQPQQYVHAGQYIQHTPSGPVPMTSYYPMYPSQHQTHMQHPNLEHQYPVYFIPARPPQAYSSPLQQTNYSESAQTAPPTRPQTHPTMVNHAAAYNPARNPPTSSSAAVAPQLVQINPGQHQPQYVNYSQIPQIHHPSQSIPPTSATPANYAYDFADPTHAKVYYSQPLAPQMAAQYQTMTSAPAVSFTETSSQHPMENSMQQIRTSQA
ncbi:putative lipid phosphate phosphatase 3, chloroplastic-like [Capsicum annuum]|nr:putative lipid phosphate phosphatase 3, chloroplastic-like [Capsicum annuum]